MEIVGLISLLGIASIEDIKKREIEILSALGFGIIGLVMHLLDAKNDIWSILGGMLVGGILFLISVLSKEQIGKGDAIIVTVCGIYLGFWDNLIVLWGATLLSGLVGIVYMIRGKRNKDLPFVPFLFVVYIILLFVDGGKGVF